MIAATSGQSHTSESANHSASCSIAYDSYAPANWREHIRESLKTLSLCCNTQAKNHVGTIPVTRRLGGASHKSRLPQVSDPGAASPLRPSAGLCLWAVPHAHLIPASVDSGRAISACSAMISWNESR